MANGATWRKAINRFWTGETGKRLRAEGPLTLLIAKYLIDGPETCWTGIYDLDLDRIVKFTALDKCPWEAFIDSPSHAAWDGTSVVRKILERLKALDFAEYDEDLEIMYVFNMALHQIGSSMRAGDKNVIKVAGDLKPYTKHRFFKDFMSKFEVSYHLRGCPILDHGTRSEMPHHMGQDMGHSVPSCTETETEDLDRDVDEEGELYYDISNRPKLELLLVRSVPEQLEEPEAPEQFEVLHLNNEKENPVLPIPLDLQTVTLSGVPSVEPVKSLSTPQKSSTQPKTTSTPIASTPTATSRVGKPAWKSTADCLKLARHLEELRDNPGSDLEKDGVILAPILATATLETAVRVLDFHMADNDHYWRDALVKVGATLFVKKFAALMVTANARPATPKNLKTLSVEEQIKRIALDATGLLGKAERAAVLAATENTPASRAASLEAAGIAVAKGNDARDAAVKWHTETQSFAAGERLKTVLTLLGRIVAVQTAATTVAQLDSTEKAAVV